MFVAMGKKKKSFIYDEEAIKEEKSISLNLVADERICDGYYYAQSFRALNRILAHPEVLETPLTDIVHDVK